MATDTSSPVTNPLHEGEGRKIRPVERRKNVALQNLKAAPLERDYTKGKFKDSERSTPQSLYVSAQRYRALYERAGGSVGTSNLENAGGNSGGRKISDAKVIAIDSLIRINSILLADTRRLLADYLVSELTQKQIAEKYRLNKNNVFNNILQALEELDAAWSELKHG